MADFNTQRDFICAHVLRETLLSNSRKGRAITYFFTVCQERIKVCKQVFLATLDIGERTVQYALDHTVGIARKDGRGKHSPGIKKSTEVHQAICDHIASFPALDSHYCRANSSNGDRTKWYWTKWHGQNGAYKMARTKW